ncbi:pilus assembly protein TadG-related protein [Evansella sp. LMS18]|uniref:pilus assembly protein TadG-related protein n=1 Tax=Evansella sp. LMS18 TaxID=2924033 RepID=UPI0020D177DF|nr:pilus assembly protein TadG-related protein [Evansella sp. LMS18]UTR11517.1 pilus assembly protein TadG-related protein [Evansella sp. LMS18]
MEKLMKVIKNEDGNVLVVVALTMVLLLGSVAFVVDAGRLYFEKSSLQKALDAAALGGAQTLASKVGNAEASAKDLSQKNNFSLQSSNVEVTSTYVKVTQTSNVPMTFAKVLGVDSVEVSATAKAAVNPLTSGNGIQPIAVSKNAVGNHKVGQMDILNCTNTGIHSGNCGYLATDGTGANALKNAIINGSSYSVGDTNPDTNPGKMQGPVSTAVKELIDKDSGKPHCQSPTTATSDCARVITIAIVETLNVNGSSPVNIIGFAHYYLHGMGEYKNGTLELKNNGDIVVGEFIKQVDLPAGGAGYEQYLLQGSRLVE